MTYAAKTKVPVDRSESEIRKMVMDRGAMDYGFRLSEAGAVIAFILNGRQIRFQLPLPKRPKATDSRAAAGYDRECREKWRALVLAIKSTLVIVSTGITSFEQEFLAHIVDPQTNRTVWETLQPQLAHSYSGKPRPLLLEPPKEPTEK